MRAIMQTFVKISQTVSGEQKFLFFNIVVESSIGLVYQSVGYNSQ